MFGLGVVSQTGDDCPDGLSKCSRIYFYPHADGTPDIELRVNSDFRIMEDRICGRLTPDRTDCGDTDVLSP